MGNKGGQAGKAGAHGHRQRLQVFREPGVAGQLGRGRADHVLYRGLVYKPETLFADKRQQFARDFLVAAVHAVGVAQVRVLYKDDPAGGLGNYAHAVRGGVSRRAHAVFDLVDAVHFVVGDGPLHAALAGGDAAQARVNQGKVGGGYEAEAFDQRGNAVLIGVKSHLYFRALVERQRVFMGRPGHADPVKHVVQLALHVLAQLFFFFNEIFFFRVQVGQGVIGLPGRNVKVRILVEARQVQLGLDVALVVVERLFYEVHRVGALFKAFEVRADKLRRR